MIQPWSYKEVSDEYTKLCRAKLEPMSTIGWEWNIETLRTFDLLIVWRILISKQSQQQDAPAKSSGNFFDCLKKETKSRKESYDGKVFPKAGASISIPA